MPKPRVPSNILELRGSFTTHPERRRVDLPGAGAWDDEPPKWLSEAERVAWAELLVALPRVALSASDRLAVVQASRIFACLKVTPTSDPAFRHLDDGFRRWASELGLTPHARARLGTATAARPANPFERFRTERNREASSATKGSH